MTHKNNQFGFAHPVLAVVLVVVIGGVGFAGYRVMHHGDSVKQVNSATDQKSVSAALPLALDDVLPVSEAKKIATGSETGTVNGVSLETEEGVLVYKVTLPDNTVQVLNAKTGDKVKKTTEAAEHAAEAGDASEQEHAVLPAAFTITVTPDKARAIAQAKYPNSKIVRIQLDVEDSKVVLSVRFADKARVDVDATTGAVVRTKDPQTKTNTPNATTPSTSDGKKATTTNASGSTEKKSGTSGTSGSGSSSTSGSSDSSESGSSHSGSGDSGSTGTTDDSGSGGSHSGGGTDDSSHGGHN